MDALELLFCSIWQPHVMWDHKQKWDRRKQMVWVDEKNHVEQEQEKQNDTVHYC